MEPIFKFRQKLTKHWSRRFLERTSVSKTNYDADTTRAVSALIAHCFYAI